MEGIKDCSVALSCVIGGRGEITRLQILYFGREDCGCECLIWEQLRERMEPQNVLSLVTVIYEGLLCPQHASVSLVKPGIPRGGQTPTQDAGGGE